MGISEYEDRKAQAFWDGQRRDWASQHQCQGTAKHGTVHAAVSIAGALSRYSEGSEQSGGDTLCRERSRGRAVRFIEFPVVWLSQLYRRSQHVLIQLNVALRCRYRPMAC